VEPSLHESMSDVCVESQVQLQSRQFLTVPFCLTVPSLESNQRPPTEEPNVHFSADEHHMDHETSSMAPAGGIP